MILGIAFSPALARPKQNPGEYQEKPPGIPKREEPVAALCAPSMHLGLRDVIRKGVDAKRQGA